MGALHLLALADREQELVPFLKQQAKKGGAKGRPRRQRAGESPEPLNPHPSPSSHSWHTLSWPSSPSSPPCLSLPIILFTPVGPHGAGDMLMTKGTLQPLAIKQDVSLCLSFPRLAQRQLQHF